MKKIILALLFSFSAIYGFSQKTISGDSIITAFHQGSVDYDKKARNCASISVIKAAICVFGIDSVFKKVDTLPDRYKVILRDNKVITLTKKQEATVNKYNHFGHTNNRVYKAAAFMYAVMAKNVLDGWGPDYEDDDITDVVMHSRKLLWIAQSTDENFRLLGLENNYKEIDNVDNIDSKVNIVIASEYHSVYSNLGFYDEYGGKNSISAFNHGTLKYTYILNP